MDEYMRKDVFLSSMGLTGDETKYGNRDAKHQHRSYSTYMSYEIIDSVEDSIVEEELAPVRHGRWETANDGTHFCSNCGCDATYTWDDIDRSFINSADDVPDRITNFCQNCGAKMDGGADNGKT